MFEKDLSAGKHFRLEKERHEPHHKKVPKPGATGRKKPLAHKTPVKKQTSNMKSHPVKKHSDIKVSTKEHRIKKVNKSRAPKRTHEERLEYYRKKYGENYAPAVKQSEDKIQPGKKSLLKKIFGLFIKD
jgi:hypothetical protein